PVVDDDSYVRIAGFLDPRRDSGCAEAVRASDAHGATPIAVRPAVSGRPSMRLAFWIACPAAPLLRLSMAATTVARPDLGWAAACRCTPLEPATAAVAGQRPAGSNDTNGSSAYDAASASRSAAESVSADVSLAVQVARMPRGIGASIGVNETVHAPPPSS